ncbi:MAG: hypothetical protein M1827_007550 [Pycnora praestabilis]|nr:MAG: hypothetical protein M1827_007550 [Pycnora praestabilis]
MKARVEHLDLAATFLNEDVARFMARLEDREVAILRSERDLDNERERKRKRKRKTDKDEREKRVDMRIEVLRREEGGERVREREAREAGTFNFS